MSDERRTIDRLFEALQERTKELNCLYRVEEILGRPDEPMEETCRRIIQALPPGWKYPEHCQAKILLEDAVYASPNFVETPWMLGMDIVAQDVVVGALIVSYAREMPPADHGSFLKEEVKLIRMVAERLGHFVLHQKMRLLFTEFETVRQDVSGAGRGEWQVVLEMLKQTDRTLYQNLSHKMLYHLCWGGVAEAEKLLQSVGLSERDADEEEHLEEWNIPQQRRGLGLQADLGAAAFGIAAAHLSGREILSLIQKWIQEDKLSFLVPVINQHRPLAEVAEAIRRYHFLVPGEEEGFSHNMRGITVSLIRRFLGDQLQFINVAKNYIQPGDFFRLMQNVIYCAESQGRLGGKSAGLYLAARILARKGREEPLLDGVRTPKTWYITSDGILSFMQQNNLDGVVEQKYKELSQIRLEYPHIVQSFKTGRFPAEILNGLSVALDDFGTVPLIVRSSSLLEDRMGAAFSGKYKSLFLPNQGSKRKRLDALTDAIAEVYASVFSPDPIEYRIERGLLDFSEEMGIMLQEVVGTRVGRHFLPSYAGVAFSKNEFRWSPRIKRDDGLIRLVPGLGTRAVDRLSDDYPVLIAPGQPGLRVNITADEILRYSPRRIDAINLETNSFETVDLDPFLKECGFELPAFKHVVSMHREGHIQKVAGMTLAPEDGEYIATFEGLVSQTPFVRRMQAILRSLEEILGTAVDIEFASDGRDLYLLQCRPLSSSPESLPSPIPRDILPERVVFTANRYVSNGRVADITHVVYVDPLRYGELYDRAEMLAVGRAVGALNQLLPKRQFVLLGPGRWGSRGDIKLGVSVTYSDINNTAVLVEVARKKGNYVPDLSFGTHFFQDLVEAGIRYLPLYPDDEGIVFNERFLRGSPNILPQVVPEFAHLKEVVRLVDVPASSGGLVLRVQMNADLDEAIGFLAAPSSGAAAPELIPETGGQQAASFWRWRMQMAERIAAQLDAERFGVAGLYVFGSTKNATAGPGSDIDLLVHFRGTPEQRAQLGLWFDGWSIALGEMNFMRTGYRCAGLLDVHFVTDEDISRRTSYASKIGAVTDAARPLAMGKSEP